MKYSIFILIVFSSTWISCNDCSNCEPFTEEPYVLVRFYSAVDSSSTNIIIDSVNQTPAAGLRHFQDTTYEYKFPLNMHEDISNFDLVFRYEANPDSVIYHSITFYYIRQFRRRDDNYVVSECNLTEIQSSIEAYNWVCKEEEICISNEAKASFYN